MKTDNELIEDFNVKHGGKPNLVADISFYESDWNMLMPVVEKIEHDGHEVDIYKNACEIDMEEGMIHEVAGNKIEATYKAVVEFIKWHETLKA